MDRNDTVEEISELYYCEAHDRYHCTVQWSSGKTTPRVSVKELICSCPSQDVRALINDAKKRGLPLIPLSAHDATYNINRVLDVDERRQKLRVHWVGDTPTWEPFSCVEEFHRLWGSIKEILSLMRAPGDGPEALDQDGDGPEESDQTGPTCAAGFDRSIRHSRDQSDNPSLQQHTNIKTLLDLPSLPQLCRTCCSGHRAVRAGPTCVVCLSSCERGGKPPVKCSQEGCVRYWHPECYQEVVPSFMHTSSRPFCPSSIHAFPEQDAPAAHGASSSAAAASASAASATAAPRSVCTSGDGLPDHMRHQYWVVGPIGRDGCKMVVVRLPEGLTVRGVAKAGEKETATVDVDLVYESGVMSSLVNPSSPHPFPPPPQLIDMETDKRPRPLLGHSLPKPIKVSPSQLLFPVDMHHCACGSVQSPCSAHIQAPHPASSPYPLRVYCKTVMIHQEEQGQTTGGEGAPRRSVRLASSPIDSPEGFLPPQWRHTGVTGLSADFQWSPHSEGFTGIPPIVCPSKEAIELLNGGTRACEGKRIDTDESATTLDIFGGMGNVSEAMLRAKREFGSGGKHIAIDKKTVCATVIKEDVKRGGGGGDGGGGGVEVWEDNALDMFRIMTDLARGGPAHDDLANLDRAKRLLPSVGVADSTDGTSSSSSSSSSAAESDKAMVRVAAACPPCQAFTSFEEMRRDAPVHHPQLRVLFIETVQAMIMIGAPVAVIENVMGLAESPRNRPLFEQCIADILSAGLQFRCLVVNASEHGSAAHRRRLVAIMAQPGYPLPEPTVIAPSSAAARGDSVLLDAINTVLQVYIHMYNTETPDAKAFVLAELQHWPWNVFHYTLKEACEHRLAHGEHPMTARYAKLSELLEGVAKRVWPADGFQRPKCKPRKGSDWGWEELLSPANMSALCAELEMAAPTLTRQPLSLSWVNVDTHAETAAASGDGAAVKGVKRRKTTHHSAQKCKHPEVPMAVCAQLQGVLHRLPPLMALLNSQRCANLDGCAKTLLRDLLGNAVNMETAVDVTRPLFHSLARRDCISPPQEVLNQRLGIVTPPHTVLPPLARHQPPSAEEIADMMMLRIPHNKNWDRIVDSFNSGSMTRLQEEDEDEDDITTPAAAAAAAAMPADTPPMHDWENDPVEGMGADGMMAVDEEGGGAVLQEPPAPPSPGPLASPMPHTHGHTEPRTCCR
ncbi:unnamed protein product [Vitrella brassicaformis CCMP3155]|uniref:Chromo domain-containing protein n=1 Tax=Vitrella brassicaformis (strain CCMP3155) TaxID=1169540 RepID=A0A0G4EU92_VITBC|nr:unnamed protein product [Vitrella brassicaformis CCMP3155]|eukprot:CEM01987.1 unnamed protein product [Vitrella brassicaformis CCMP3155]